MKVRIKKLHKDAKVPTYAKPGDAGMDLTAVGITHDQDGNVVYNTGLAFEIPEDHVGLLFPRSSNAKKHLTLSNSVGVIDSGYRGEIAFKFKGMPHVTVEGDIVMNKYEVGDRVGQIIILPYPQIEFVEADELSETERGDGGYGSSGK